MSFVDEVFSSVPWLRPFLAWSLAIALVVLVMLLPAYYLLLPLLEKLRAEMRKYLDRLQQAHAKNRLTRSEAQERWLVDGGISTDVQGQEQRRVEEE
jgi:hypothetical protein